MLAPPEKAERPDAPPAEEKRRTVTLTNARPVLILESQWPVVAEGKYADENHPEYPVGWSVDFRVRMDRFNRHLIHGKYSFHDEMNESYQTIRVGRLLSALASEEVERHLLEVGEEMRERINNKGMTKYVTFALDACFASFGAQVV